jgi:predicted short-subunit dehydrogenase-like oxidoreductase (DUF2520 family)
MLPAMAGKPQIAIVGAGNLAAALAVSLQRAGYNIEAIISRSGRASLNRAKRLAQEVKARAITATRLHALRAEMIWLCVPDSQIQRAAQSLADAIEWKGRLVFHSSGALTSDELAPLRDRGAVVASVHPFMTFVRGSRPPLAGVPFAIEGDARAVRIARRMVKDLGGEAYAIRKADKAAYHAWGTFCSPLLAALFETAEQVAAMAGVQRAAARRRMIPILLQTLANYATSDAAQAFSGPIIRGDTGTVARHLRVLRKLPHVLDVYKALARSAIRYLPAENKRELMRLLNSAKA